MADTYTVELTESEVSKVLLALTVYANQNDEPSGGETRQLGKMIAQTVERDTGPSKQVYLGEDDAN